MTSPTNDHCYNGRPTIAILSPSLAAVSGVSTHARLLFNSSLASDFRLVHFQVGSEGRNERPLRRALRLATSPLEFAAFLLRERPTVVHLNPSLEPRALWRDAIFLVISKLLRRRVVFQVHGGAFPNDFFSGSRFRNAIVRRLFRSADVVVLLSELERIAYDRFDSRLHTTVIPNAIDPAGLTAADTRRSTSGRPLRLVYVGRLIASKGIFHIIEAVRLLQTRGIAVTLTIAGSGRDEERLLTEIGRLPRNDSVTFRGVLLGEDKEQAWREADVFVFPTFFPEGLPYAILESMAAGAVPVTTPVGAIPELIQCGLHGVLIRPHDPAALADALMRLNEDREGVANMASAARQRILSRYTVPRLARDFRDLYWRLLPGPGRPDETHSK